MKFGEMEWFKERVKVFAHRAFLSERRGTKGKRDDGCPFYLRNLQDDLIAVALGPKIAGVLSGSVGEWCEIGKVPISV